MLYFHLRSLMDSERISINKLSKDTNINRASLTGIANNETSMVRIDTLNKLCKYFNCNLSVLMNETPDTAILKINIEKHLKNEELLCSFSYEGEFGPINSNCKIKIKSITTYELIFNDTDRNFDLIKDYLIDILDETDKEAISLGLFNQIYSLLKDNYNFKKKDDNLGVLYDVAFNSFTLPFMKDDLGNFLMLNNSEFYEISTRIPVCINGKMLPEFKL